MKINYLRLIGILLSAGLMLNSCSTDEPSEQRSELRFEISGVSRSPLTTVATITKNPFAVFGDRIDADHATDNSVEPTPVFHNTRVQYINSAWSTSEPQYWYNNHEHSFVAIHPASVLTTEANINYTNNQLSFTYTLPSDLTQTADILSATHRRHYTDNRKKDESGKTTGAAEAVSLRFGHMMTQINITASVNDNIMGDNGYLEFQKFEMSGFKSKAEFVIRPASLQTNNQTDDREITISVAEGEATGNMTIAFTEPIKVANGKSGQLFSNSEDAIVMVPQEFAEDSKAQIILTYKASNESAAKQITLPLKGLKWESGKSYNYRFTVGKHGPLYEGATITEWEVFEAGTFVTK